MATPHPQLALFPRGLSAGAKLLIYLLISIVVITADTRFHSLNQLRAGASSLLWPIQKAAQTPWLLWRNMGNFFTKQDLLLHENQWLHAQFVRWQWDAQRLNDLEQENRHLRHLLALRARQPATTHAAQIFGVPRDPYLSRITVDQGSQQGIDAGAAVIDETGLIGQVTRVYPLTSEVTLITDKDQSVPIQIQRTGERAILFGTGASHTTELRYLPANTDIRIGDTLVTSGLDGLYPPGVPVARVTHIDAGNSRAFVLIECQPLGAVDRNRQVLILNLPQAR